MSLVYLISVAKIDNIYELIMNFYLIIEKEYKNCCTSYVSKIYTYEIVFRVVLEYLYVQP